MKLVNTPREKITPDNYLRVAQGMFTKKYPRVKHDTGEIKYTERIVINMDNFRVFMEMFIEDNNLSKDK